MCHHRMHHRHWSSHAKHRRHQWRKKFMQHGHWGGAYPPVNIEEFDDRYELSVFAAGFTKEDFEVKIKDQTLLISARKEENDLVDNPRMKRQEFDPQGFKRIFELNKKIDKDQVTATYQEGVLHLTFPKLEGFETYRKDIDIV